ncbi:enoyl-CoA hydratase/isomerase family protein [Roseibium aggregatum]|uniref:Enoyl-CoA hydratase/isomerase family protein n=1 Tax=Roseibium aggregatum TaxID=187304 RepID=A0A939J452_9HYPH|nr:enoyl-CoA hydratase-related protein [Roseibium aggregatum]MBN9670830.1 enoyl-CoA hydratase/isomerase family protein [Roseibium aggregatum]
MSETDPAAAGLVTCEIAEGVALLRLERPSVRNALSLPLLVRLAGLMVSCDADREVRCIVLTGGVRVFSAGADVEMLSGHNPASYMVSENRQAFDRIRETRKPVVAAVAGYCLGGGCEIALGCDFVVAADNAVFGQPEINLGIIPGAGGTQLWAPRAGSGVQARAVLEGGLVGAYEARRRGIADCVVPVEALIPAAMEIAAALAAKAPLAVQAAKSAMRFGWRAPMAAALELEVVTMAGLLASEDAAEGIDAFLAKRQPSFGGR